MKQTAITIILLLFFLFGCNVEDEYTSTDVPFSAWVEYKVWGNATVVKITYNDENELKQTIMTPEIKTKI